MFLKKSLAAVLGTTIFFPFVGNHNVFGENTRTEGKELIELKEKSKKIDLFEDKNLDDLLRSALKFILNNDDSPYIDSKVAITDDIRQNSLISECLASTLKHIEDSSAPKDDKDLETLKRLRTIENMMSFDKKISDDNAAYRFISAMRLAYQTVVARKVAQEILNTHRESIESKLGSESISGNISSSFDVVDGVGISIGASTQQSSTETSFYKIDTSGNVGISLGIGLEDYLKANVGCAIEVTNSIVFYSLEQFLNSEIKDGNSTPLKITNKEIKEIISVQKFTQSSEKEIISRIKTSVEWFLKAANIVPQDTKFAWPEIAQKLSPEKQSEINIKAEGNAAASCIASLGMSTTVSRSFTKNKISHPYLDLINKDCQVSEYFIGATDLIEFLGQKDTEKYQGIKKAIEGFENEDDKSQALSIIISNFIGDLRRYNSALSVLADEKSTEEEQITAHETKKLTEKEWVGKGTLKKLHNNRSTMLKIAISTAVYLKTLSDDYPELDDLFNSLYDEIEHLSIMQKFSNQLFEKNTTFETFRKSDAISATGKTSFSIPVIGEGNVSITYSNSNSPLYTEDSEDLTLAAQLPIVQGEVYGIKELKEKIKNWPKSLSKKDPRISKIFSNSLDILDKEFENMLLNYGIEKTMGIPTVFSINNYMNLNFFFTNVPKTLEDKKIIPLPGHNIIKKDDDEIVLKLAKRIDNNLAKLKLKVKDVGIDASGRLGKASSKLGDNTLIFIVNKFNACQLADNEKESRRLWNNFKSGQKDSLKNLLVNMTSEDKNARYELQQMYSMIMNNIEDKKSPLSAQKNILKTTVENIFTNLLASCEDLANNPDVDPEIQDKKYDKALNLLDAVLKMNFEYAWLPALKASMTVQK